MGVGYDGGLYWTNAFESDSPSNWARFTLSFAEAGSYQVEIYLDPAFAVADGVPYDVTHGELLETVVVDQSAQNGWTTLGTFDFSAGGEQSVDVRDDQPEPVADAQHVAVDALRLTREGLPPPDEPGGGSPSDPPDDPPSTGGAEPDDPLASGVPSADDEGSCTVGHEPGRPRGAAPSSLAALFAGLGAARRARRRAGAAARGPTAA
jgi:hypothetical protein